MFLNYKQKYLSVYQKSKGVILLPPAGGFSNPMAVCKGEGAKKIEEENPRAPEAEGERKKKEKPQQIRAQLAEGYHPDPNYAPHAVARLLAVA